MAKQRLLLLAILLSGLSVIGTSQAQNFTVSPDTGGKSTQPNLGFAPRETEPAPATAPTTEPTKNTNYAQPVSSAPSTAPTANQKTAPVQTKAPAVKYVPPAPPIKPYTLSVSVADPKWNENDLINVFKQAGIPQNSVASQCQLGVSTNLMTDKSVESLDLATQTKQIKYDGSIYSASTSLYALCDSAPKPAPYSYLQRIGNKYGVFVSSTFCSAPPKSAAGAFSKLVIKHPSKGSDSCQFM